MLSNTIDLPSTCVCVHAQSCLTLCNLMNCSLPSSSVRGIFQARILEWVAISSSRASYSPRVEPMSPAFPALASGFFTAEPSGKHPLLSTVHLLFLDLPQLPFILYSISITFTIRKHRGRETLTLYFFSVQKPFPQVETLKYPKGKTKQSQGSQCQGGNIIFLLLF